ncbi:MAG: hypothetical protein KDA85_02030, partial [Planctomycetaceae bacterium]|nr:hypothetical protein [Planctomycetaceae bacterium]
MKFLGLDIGGANLKLATADGHTRSSSFAMWQRHAELTAELQRLATDVFAQPDLIGLTMTAELA